VLKKVLALAALFALSNPAYAVAQDKLIQLLPKLFGNSGLTVDSDAPLAGGISHSAHFNSSFQQSFTPFNTALATQLAAVPLPSPASGFTYSLDPALGVFKRSTQSFGPILSDRAETIGKKKLSMGFTYQRFSFDSIDGLDLGAVPVVFTHDNPVAGTGRDDVVTTSNAIDLKVSQFTAFLNYGLTDRMDVSLAIPLVSVDFAATSIATIQRIGTINPAIHFYGRTPSGGFGNQATFSSSGSATGIGDILLRLKATAYRQGGTGLAVGGEVRLPTGDEEDLLGSGATGIKPFVVFSSAHERVSPHVKLAYQWNGESVLAAGVIGSGEKGDLPDQFFYEVGADLGVSKKLTLALDLLGRRVIDGERLSTETFQALDNQSTFPNVRFQTESFNVIDGAVGVKINPTGSLLVDFNLLFKLNDSGLRDTVTPLLGIEYSF